MGMLASQKISSSKDASCGNKDSKMDVWAY